MSRTAIAPIISVVCLGIGAITGHAISASVQDEIVTISATAITAGLSIWGILKNHKKEV